MEEYDILKIKGLSNKKSDIKIDSFRLSEEGIAIQANGTATDICLNNVQLNKSRLEKFFTTPIYFPLVATFLIIISNIIGYFIKRFYQPGPGNSQ